MAGWKGRGEMGTEEVKKGLKWSLGRTGDRADQRNTEELPKSVKGKVEAGNLVVLEVTGIQSVLQQDHSVMKCFTQKTKFLKILMNKILYLY